VSVIGISFTAFFVTLVGSVFGICYLAHRFERQSDWLLEQWWGAPASIFGGCAVMFGLAIAAASIVRAVA
jgi:hypothetical protein